MGILSNISNIGRQIKDFQKGRNDRKQMKLDARQKRLETRQAGRNYRSDNRVTKTSYRQGAKAIAYSQGIDPNADMWGSIASLGQSAGGIATLFSDGGIFSALGSGLFAKGKNRNTDPNAADNTTLFVGIGAAVVVLLLVVMLFSGGKK